MLAWYLLYSKPRQEGVAVENLKRQGYETYLPLIRTRRRRQGQYVSLVEPMFPRYLFIHLSDQTDNWGPIRSTLGVSALVRFGDLPAQVPDRLIDALKSREDDSGIQLLASQVGQIGDASGQAILRPDALDDLGAAAHHGRQLDRFQVG